MAWLAATAAVAVIAAGLIALDRKLRDPDFYERVREEVERRRA